MGAAKNEFVVPEIGFPMAALAVYGAHSPEYLQGQAQRYAGTNPGTPAMVLADVADWLK